MAGPFQEALSLVHEFQHSLKRQLEIGNYMKGDRLSVELRVKVARTHDK